MRSPGRVNLIGDHTDYNGGWAMPMAIGPATWIAYGSAPGGRITVVSDDEPGTVSFAPSDPERVGGWGNFVQGVVKAYGADEDLGGWQAAIATDLPVGAGLSSSAALELGIACVLSEVGGIPWDPRRAALAGRFAENEWVGANTGLMDQLTVAHGVAGCALLMDCRSLELRPVPIPEAVAIVVLDTGVSRSLVTSAYADRRDQCETVAATLGVPSLREATLADIENASLDPVSYRRAHHVLTENQRVLDFAEALVEGEVGSAGELMVASHESLRDDYEVTGPALDAMFEAAIAAPGALGARMTGGGFAGAVVALVEATRSGEFMTGATKAYEATFGGGGSAFVATPSQGVAMERKAVAM